MTQAMKSHAPLSTEPQAVKGAHRNDRHTLSQPGKSFMI